MNISDLLNASNNASLGGSRTSSAATSGVNAASQALQKAEKRLQTQLDATTAQLSSFGKLKSALSDAQLAARGLSGLTANATSAGMASAVAKFVTAYNSAVSTAASTAALAGTTSESVSANRAGNDMRRSLTASTATLDALKKMGFSLASNGTLALDAKKFDAAQKADPSGVRASLVKIGQWVDQTATRELAAHGNVDGSVTSLNTRAANLKSQQTALENTRQAIAPDQNPISLSPTGYGIGAYQSASNSF
jgi:flagellar capping protein FliD